MRLPVLLLAVAAVAAPNQQPLLESSSSLLTSSSSSTPSSPPSTSPVDPAIFASLERLARIVDIAYCVGTAGSGIGKPFSCLSRCRDFPELRLVATFNTGVLLGDTCGYVAVDDVHNEVIVAFRGTYSLTNTVEDLRTIPQEYIPYEPDVPDDDGSDDDNGNQKPTCSNCTVHAGFYDSWQSARPLVLPAVMAARNASSTSPPLRVRIVGHSLGGAVAALAGLEMRAILGWGDDVRVTTFGEPRVGNEGLANFVEAVFGLNEGSDSTDAFHRVTHRNDPVPLLPLAEWGFRTHAGEIFIDKVDLPPAPADVVRCHGRDDPACLAGPSSSHRGDTTTPFPRLRPWELFFAHRDYFWRIGLCVPGGDPADWWRWGQHDNRSASLGEL